MMENDTRAWPGAVIGGAPANGEHTLEIVNPAGTGLVGSVRAVGISAAREAIESARQAFPSWASAADAEHRRALVACADILRDNAEELARLLTAEQGKPLNGTGSRFEIGGAEAWTRHTASLGLPIDTIQDDDTAHVSVHRKPLGVVASITPWNWPVLIAIWHIMPALRVGNTVVIKPSPLTPLSTLRMVELFQQVLPPGVLNVVVGADEIGSELTSHPAVAKVCFTGSAATGRKVMQSAAPTLKRLTLELGGNDAGIVLPDCSPEGIAQDLFWGAFINNGQTCAALKRLYVHDTRYEAVCSALAAVATSIRPAPGIDEEALLGPMQNRAQMEKVDSLVRAAASAGARILTGGYPAGGEGFFYPPTIVADAEAGMALVDEEQFGPALPVIRYSDLDEAIAQANDSPFGLGGSVWSSDARRARDIAMQLECGTAWVNKHGAIRPDTPFGGIKASGFGVEFGPYGLEEFVSLHVLND